VRRNNEKGLKQRRGKNMRGGQLTGETAGFFVEKPIGGEILRRKNSMGTKGTGIAS